MENSRRLLDFIGTLRQQEVLFPTFHPASSDFSALFLYSSYLLNSVLFSSLTVTTSCIWELDCPANSGKSGFFFIILPILFPLLCHLVTYPMRPSFSCQNCTHGLSLLPFSISHLRSHLLIPYRIWFVLIHFASFCPVLPFLSLGKGSDFAGFHVPISQGIPFPSFQTACFTLLLFLNLAGRSPSQRKKHDALYLNLDLRSQICHGLSELCSVTLDKVHSSSMGKLRPFPKESLSSVIFGKFSHRWQKHYF